MFRNYVFSIQVSIALSKPPRRGNHRLVTIFSLPTRKPDVLVSDIGMPEEDGYILIKKVRGLSSEEGGDLPAIALTGYVGVEERMRALETGIKCLFQNPLTLVNSRPRLSVWSGLLLRRLALVRGIANDISHIGLCFPGGLLVGTASFRQKVLVILPRSQN